MVVTEILFLIMCKLYTEDALKVLTLVYSKHCGYSSVTTPAFYHTTIQLYVNFRLCNDISADFISCLQSVSFAVHNIRKGVKFNT